MKMITSSHLSQIKKWKGGKEISSLQGGEKKVIQSFQSQKIEEGGEAVGKMKKGPYSFLKRGERKKKKEVRKNLVCLFL